MGYQIYLIDEENSLRKLFSTLKVNCILFLSQTDLRNDEEIVQYGLENHICLRIAPFLTEQTQWSKIQLRNIQIEDLLSREEINIDLDNIRNELSGSVIMVTGAAGSIGSELCRQLCCFNLKQLILFDFSETATYEVDMELKKRFPDRSILPIIGDVRNRDRVESQTRLYPPRHHLSCSRIQTCTHDGKISMRGGTYQCPGYKHHGRYGIEIWRKEIHHDLHRQSCKSQQCDGCYQTTGRDVRTKPRECYPRRKYNW